jgi:DNA-binding MarR family transcriptional regulator
MDVAVPIDLMPGHLIRRLHQISTSVFQRAMAEAGLDLSPVQFAALDAMARAPGSEQARIAGMIAYDRATIGGVIDRLEARGLVSRQPSRTDRRARTVSLTAAGTALLEAARPVVTEAQTDILAGLDAKDRAQFTELAARVARAGNALSRAPMIQSDTSD